MKYNEKKFEELLRRTFSASAPPPETVTRTVLAHLQEKEKEQCHMKISLSKRLPILAAALCLLLSGTVFASWHFLNASSVAKELSVPALASAFMEPDAQRVNAIRTQKGYIVSLLGLTNGKALTQTDAHLKETSTYAVVAIAKEDGTPIDTENNSYFVSPLIQGLEPWMYNIASMTGSYSEFMENGILYRLIECDDIEIFANQKLYLCVTDSTFYPTEAFRFDEKTGTITEKQDYEGLNILFDLPLDASKADPQKAKAYVDSLWAIEDTSDEITDTSSITAEEILEKGTVLQDSIQKVFPDEKGMLHYSYVSADGIEIKESISVEALFPNNGTGLSQMFSSTLTESGKNGSILYEKADDGSVTIRFVEW